MLKGSCWVGCHKTAVFDAPELRTCFCDRKQKVHVYSLHPSTLGHFPFIYLSAMFPSLCSWPFFLSLFSPETILKKAGSPSSSRKLYAGSVLWSTWLQGLFSSRFKCTRGRMKEILLAGAGVRTNWLLDVRVSTNRPSEQQTSAFIHHVGRDVVPGTWFVITCHFILWYIIFVDIRVTRLFFWCEMQCACVSHICYMGDEICSNNSRGFYIICVLNKCYIFTSCATTCLHAQIPCLLH